MKENLVLLPFSKTIIREYHNSYDITHKMEQKSIDLIVQKNSISPCAIHSVYIYERGGPLLHYYEQGKSSFEQFLYTLSQEERIIIKRWLKKFSNKKTAKATLHYLKQQVQC